MSARASYAARFGEEQAAALERAACQHENGVHDNRGSDPFKWAVLICIGYQCVEIYHEEPFADFQVWAKECAELGTHDGDCDFLTLFVGGYNQYMPDAEEVA